MRALRAGTPITVAGISFIPIERVQISCGTQPHAYWLNATKDALAVVICDLEGPRAVGVEAHELPIEEFIAEIPELGSLLAGLLPRT